MTKYTVKERFLQYVQIDTEADPASKTYPSSEKQKDMTKLILKELEEMGIEASSNDAGYVYATLPGNTDSDCKTVFFCAHFDTTPDCSGKNVKPIVHKNYDGSDILLPDNKNEIVSPSKYPYLNEKIGDDIITASGLTLLGSDDKSGVAIIMDAFRILKENPDIKHGPVKILFTTDEEIGKGVDKVDLDRLDADFGYTLDGGELGTMEAENFSADGAKVTISGVPIHPCCALGKMENAIKIASDIIASLPKDRLSPETTEGYEGFIHPISITGKMESAELKFILRDFETKKLKDHARLIDDTCRSVLKNYPKSSYTLTTNKQYRNMKDVVDQFPYVIEVAKKAMEKCGIKPRIEHIRGGTDGAQLSHKGLPCPNLFTGMQAIHSPHEWVSVQDMEKAVDTVVEICRLTAEII